MKAMPHFIVSEVARSVNASRSDLEVVACGSDGAALLSTQWQSEALPCEVSRFRDLQELPSPRLLEP